MQPKRQRTGKGEWEREGAIREKGGGKSISLSSVHRVIRECKTLNAAKIRIKEFIRSIPI